MNLHTETYVPLTVRQRREDRNLTTTKVCKNHDDDFFIGHELRFFLINRLIFLQFFHKTQFLRQIVCYYVSKLLVKFYNRYIL